MLETSQEDLDPRAPRGVVTPRLQDAEIPDHVVQQRLLRRLLGFRRDPVNVVDFLDCDSAATGCTTGNAFVLMSKTNM